MTHRVLSARICLGPENRHFTFSGRFNLSVLKGEALTVIIRRRRHQQVSVLALVPLSCVRGMQKHSEYEKSLSIPISYCAHAKSQSPYPPDTSSPSVAPSQSLVPKANVPAPHHLTDAWDLPLGSILARYL